MRWFILSNCSKGQVGVNDSCRLLTLNLGVLDHAFDFELNLGGEKLLDLLRGRSFSEEVAEH